MLCLVVFFLSFDPARPLLCLKGALIRYDLVGKFGVGWFPPSTTLARLVCCAGPGRIFPHAELGELKSGVSGVQGAMYC